MVGSSQTSVLFSDGWLPSVVVGWAKVSWVIWTNGLVSHCRNSACAWSGRQVDKISGRMTDFVGDSGNRTQVLGDIISRC